MRIQSFIALIFVAASLLSSCTKPKTVILANVPKGGDFALPSTKGDFKTQSLRGKTTFLFFGFGHCKDVCPMALHQMAELIKSLPASDQEKIAVLFVSVDPERDTIKVLIDKMKALGPQFIGATDTTERLHQIAALYGATFRKDANGDFDHTSDFFVLSPKGELVDHKPYNAPIKDLKNAFYAATSAPPLNLGAPTEENAKMLGENKNCDLSHSACTVETEAGAITLTLEPTPIEVNRPLAITAKAANLKAEALDISGDEINMGYIRPTLKAHGADVFEGFVTLPTCELAKMTWVARPLLRDASGHLVTAEFRFTTVSRTETAGVPSIPKTSP